MIIFFTVLTTSLLLNQAPPTLQQRGGTASAQAGKSISNPSQPPPTSLKTEGNTPTSNKNSDQKQTECTTNPKNAGSSDSSAPTWIIAGFTCLTFIVFCYQIKIIHDTERAWVLVTDFRKPVHLEWITVTPAIFPREEFEWTIKNTGRTPARIIDIRLRFHCVSNINQLPPYPDYGDGKCMNLASIPTDGTMIAQNDEWSIAVFFEGPNGEPSAPTQEQMDSIRKRESFLVSCGSVTYKDVFDRKHETRFCYIYRTEMPKHPHTAITGWFSTGGPENYNTTT